MNKLVECVPNFSEGRDAAATIDMTRRHGSDARMGAMDVCPFVPVAGVTMADCVALARETGRRIGGLGIPVYLYEHAASGPARRNLAAVRAGEYEGLERKLADPQWRPDFGPARHNPRTGAFIIGAREFLIAYNVNLATTDSATRTTSPVACASAAATGAVAM